MKGLLEYKAIKNTIEDIDLKKRVVTGYLSSFIDEKDSYGDVVMKGAFAKSIADRKDEIFFLNQHKWNQPHGKFQVLQEDSKGLYFESEPLIDTTYSSDALKLYEAGIINQHSFGYNTMRSDYDKSTDTRYLKEIKLFEGSNVTMGAQSDTPFMGMKALTIEEIDEKVLKIMKALRKGTFTDDTFLLLEIALKELQRDAYKLGCESLTPPTTTIVTEKPKVAIDIISNFKY